MSFWPGVNSRALVLVRSWNIMSGWTKHTTVHEFNALFPGLSKFNFLNRGETDLWKETSDYTVITSLFQITYLEVGDRTSGSANRYRSVTTETALRSLLWSAESLDGNSQWGKRQRLMVHLDSPLNLQCYLLYHHSQVSQYCVSRVMYRIFLCTLTGFDCNPPSTLKATVELSLTAPGQRLKVNGGTCFFLVCSELSK